MTERGLIKCYQTKNIGKTDEYFEKHLVKTDNI